MAIHLTRIDELAVVALDRPEVLNALNFELLRDLGAALDQVATGDARALSGNRRRRQSLLRRRRRQGADGALFAGSTRGPRFRTGDLLQARRAADPIHRADLRIRLRRWPRTGARVRLPAGRRKREARVARDQARLDPGLWRYAASAAADRRSARARNHPDRPHRRGGGSRADRPRQSHRQRAI